MARPDEVNGRYSAVSLVLHWTIALLVIGQIVLVWMHEAAGHHGPDLWIPLHKANGLAILALTLVRIGWRIAHPAIPLPKNAPAWQNLIARLTHIGFYVLMIGLPLGGWLAMSYLGRPIEMWGLVEVPMFPVEHARDTGRAILGAHKLAGKALIYGLIPLHVLGALKHHFMDRDDVLRRMLPFLPRRT